MSNSAPYYESDLRRLLRGRISREGSLSFSEFMAGALYHEKWGYYSQPGRVGRKGDFFTSVSVGPLFGELLARWVVDRVNDSRWSAPWVLIEQGAEAGHLGADLLAGIRSEAPDLFDPLTYQIIEPFESLRELQRKTLQRAGFIDKVVWVESPEKIRHPVGIFLSNELVDSFPVDVVRFAEGNWVERRVALGEAGDDGEFVWDESSPAREALLREIRRWKIPETEGYVAEIHLRAAEWMRSIAATIDEGFFLTIDYGYPADQLYAPERCEGTAQAYRNHQRSNDLLDSPGHQDLTAHVHFDLLIEEGRRLGLEPERFEDQHHFLVGITKLGWLQEMEKAIQSDPAHPDLQKKVRAFQSLIHPEMMGTTFRALVQRK